MPNTINLIVLIKVVLIELCVLIINKSWNDFCERMNNEQNTIKVGMTFFTFYNCKAKIKVKPKSYDVTICNCICYLNIVYWLHDFYKHSGHP